MLARGIDSRFVPPSANAAGVVGRDGGNAGSGAGRGGAGGAVTRWVLRNGALCIGTGREALQSGASKAGRTSKGGGARRPQTSARRRHTDTDLSPYRNKAARPASAAGPLRRGMAGMSVGAPAPKTGGASPSSQRGTGRLSDEAIESYVAGLLERASVGHMKRAAVSAAWGGAVRDALRRTAWE